MTHAGRIDIRWYYIGNRMQDNQMHKTSVLQCGFLSQSASTYDRTDTGILLSVESCLQMFLETFLQLIALQRGFLSQSAATYDRSCIVGLLYIVTKRSKISTPNFIFFLWVEIWLYHANVSFEVTSFLCSFLFSQVCQNLVSSIF